MKPAILILFFCLAANGFSSCFKGDEKNWLSEKPHGAKYKYFVGIGESLTSFPEARSSAYFNALEMIINELDTGKTVVDSKFSRFQELLTKGKKEEIKEKIFSEINLNGSTVYLPSLEEFDSINKACFERGSQKYSYGVVLRFLKDKPDEFSEPPDSPKLRSILFPGWGQYYIGEKTKGIYLLVSEGILLPTALSSLYLAYRDSDLATKQTTKSRKEFYNNKAEIESYISLITGAGALGVYIYNLIDSFSYKPPNYYAVNNNKVTFSAGFNKFLITYHFN